MSYPFPPAQPQPHGPQHTPPRKRRGARIAIGVLALFVVIGVAAACGARNSGGAGQSTMPRSAAPALTAPQPPATSDAPADAGIHDGTYEVGVDVEPGKYRTAGPDPDSIVGSCYWARLSSTDGSVGSIIANGIVSGPTTVTIKASDAAFKTSRCAVWQRVNK